MAVRIKFDNTNNVIPPRLILANRNGNRICKIPEYGVAITDNFGSYFELSFKVDKFNNGVPFKYWDDIKTFKLGYSFEYDTFFELYVEKTDEGVLTKNVSGVSLCEAELSQISLNGIELNTEADIELDDYKPRVIYSNDKSSSILDILLEKAPHYSIEYVAPSIRNIQRTFEFDGTNIYDAFNEIAEEVHCIFVYDSGMDSDGLPKRKISVYDIESYCSDCGHREEFFGNCPKCGSDDILPGYGEDTNILISSENLADNITFTTDKDSVKNCFKLEAGDDLMTATIRSCNPNGSDYIWYLSDDVKSDMSHELQDKIAEYDSVYEIYATTRAIPISGDILEDFNQIVAKYANSKNQLKTIELPLVGYSSLVDANYSVIDLQLYLHDLMMPNVDIQDTTAQIQAQKISSGALTHVAVADVSKVSLSTANTSVLTAVKSHVNPMYQVKVYSSRLDNGVWIGRIKFTNYSNDEDTAISSEFRVVISDDFETTVKQRLTSSLGNNSDNVTDIVGLFNLSAELFTAELKRYNLVSLTSFEKICNACLNILIENGISNDSKWKMQNKDLYAEIYEPYYNKLIAIQDEIKERESELKIVEILSNEIFEQSSAIQEILNFQDFLGEDLWKEFSSYRRDDVYQNSNFISDGLDNKEILENAIQFMEEAKKEIFKSATLQHTISASMKNLLVMDGFKSITDKFQVGNWIRVKVDGEVFRLRLLSYVIDYDSIEDINVTFSDVQTVYNGISDAESILSRASSIAGSYDSVKRQSKKGNKSHEQLVDWAEKGLALTKMKIIDDADRQNVTFDDNGLLCRQYDDLTEEYDSKQLKIINKGLYLTDDNWRTSKAGIGEFTFYNPKTEQIEEDYGVIANTIVGSIILGEEVGIYTEQGSITLDNNGLTIISDGTLNNGDDEGQTVFTVNKKTLNENNEVVYSPICYIDTSGELVLNGSMKILPDGDRSSVESLNDLIKGERFDTMIKNALDTTVESLNRTMDEKYDELRTFADDLLNGYKSEVEQYMTFDKKDGLVIGSNDSAFSTNITNQGMWFLEKDSETGNDVGVAYIMNKILHIPNAEVTSRLVVGKFFLSPRGDGGMSLTWEG